MILYIKTIKRMLQACAFFMSDNVISYTKLMHDFLPSSRFGGNTFLFSVREMFI